MSLNIKNPIICGPMLRKVTKYSVNIFIALDTEWKVELRLYEDDPEGAGNPIASIDKIQPKRIGENLWVQVATIDSSSATALPELEYGKNYFYDVVLSAPSTGEEYTLKDLGFLSQDNSIIGFPLGYQENHLPSFALPPPLENLNIIHGSCRKPHGKGEDQLAELDNIISKDHNSPLERPHQLFLTGDQIYADDVHSELLELLTGTGDYLLGVAENFSNAVKNTSPRNEVKNRKVFMEDKSKTNLTSDHREYHLMYLSEFYAMYLFSWSGYPYSLKTLKEGYLIDTSIPHIYGPGSTTPNHHLNISSDLVHFCKTLPMIRRALANISTFMIFDDHEVTDDWYLDGKWKKNALSNQTTTQIIRNGLISYAIFQDWGNQPESYKNNNTFWNSVNYNTSTNNNFFIEVLENNSSTLKHELYGHLGLIDTAPHQHSWFYNLSFDEYEINVLDTRTRRNYHDNFTQLISESDFDNQLPISNSNKKITIIISPSPILGMPIIEGFQKFLIEIGRSKEEFDYESWITDPETYNALLSHLSRYKQAIILSGDVHYAYTSKCCYFNGGYDSDDSATLIQLCSSSLKNAGGLAPVAQAIDVGLIKEFFLCYDTKNINIDSIRKKKFLIPSAKDHLPSYNRYIDYDRFNPRKFDIKTITLPSSEIFLFKDLLQENHDVAISNIKETKSQYFIDYIEHTLNYSSANPIDFISNKVLSKPNFGNIKFDIKNNEVFIIHDLRHKESIDQPFSCRVSIKPIDSFSEKKKLWKVD